MLGNRQNLVVGEHREVLIRDLGNKQDICSLPRLCGGEVLLQRLIVQASQPAEEVELPRGK